MNDRFVSGMSLSWPSEFSPLPPALLSGLSDMPLSSLVLAYFSFYGVAEASVYLLDLTI